VNAAAFSSGFPLIGGDKVTTSRTRIVNLAHRCPNTSAADVVKKIGVETFTVAT